MNKTVTADEAARAFTSALINLIAAVHVESAKNPDLPPAPRQSPVAHLTPQERSIWAMAKGQLPDPALLSSRDAAKFLGCSERHLYTLDAPRGPLPFLRLGTLKRYQIEDLKRMVDALKVRPATSALKERDT